MTESFLDDPQYIHGVAIAPSDGTIRSSRSTGVLSTDRAPCHKGISSLHHGTPPPN